MPPREYRVIVQGTVGVAVASSFDDMTHEYIDGNTVASALSATKLNCTASCAASPTLGSRC
jgi:hypothetical protein